jgi:hypothetical protein
MSLALRGGRAPFTLEKWYVDTLLPDGGVLLVYLGTMRVLGVAIARVTAELFEESGRVRRGAAKARVVEGGASWLRFGPASIDGERLAWKTDGLSGELRFAPRHPGVEPRSPFLEEDGRRLSWTIEVPDADVEGAVEWPGGGRDIEGRGYRDRVFFDLLPWRFPIRELVWGRAVAGTHAAAWVAATTPRETVTVRWEDGRVSSALAEPELDAGRVLVQTAVADIEGLHFGLLRPLLRRMTGDPVEVKWACPATLHGIAGRAVHERVTWR